MSTLKKTGARPADPLNGAAQSQWTAGAGGMPIEPFLAAAEVGVILGRSPDWVYDQAVLWERTAGLRGLPSYKLAGTRRFRWSEIEAALISSRERRTRRGEG